MRKAWKKNGSYAHHWTESDPRTIDYLREKLQEEPKKVEIGNGYDFLCGDVRIEAKACNTWIQAKQSNGNRRRGCYQFFGHEKSDFILFILILESGDLKMSLLPGEAIDSRIGKGRLAFSWIRVFPELGGSI